MKFVEVDVFEVTARVCGISGNQFVANVNSRTLQQAAN
jgi:hypothetical protein